MFCYHCGKQLPEGSLFCNYCGSRLPHTEPIPDEPAEQKDFGGFGVVDITSARRVPNTLYDRAPERADEDDSAASYDFGTFADLDDEEDDRRDPRDSFDDYMDDWDDGAGRRGRRKPNLIWLWITLGVLAGAALITLALIAINGGFGGDTQPALPTVVIATRPTQPVTEAPTEPAPTEMQAPTEPPTELPTEPETEPEIEPEPTEPETEYVEPTEAPEPPTEDVTDAPVSL